MLPELNKIQSEELFITVRGITGCGDILESTSNGFVIDASPPAIDILQTGQKAVENITSDSIYQNEQTFSSTWTVSEESGEAISHVTATVGSYPGGDDLMNTTQVAADHIRVDITAPEGVASYVTVTATNKAGLVGSQYSAPVVMDTSLPEVNYVSCVILLLFKQFCQNLEPYIFIIFLLFFRLIALIQMICRISSSVVGMS